MKRIIMMCCCVFTAISCSNNKHEINSPKPQKETLYSSVFSYDEMAIGDIYPLDLKVIKYGRTTELLNVQYQQLSGEGTLKIYPNGKQLLPGETISIETDQDVLTFDYSPTTIGSHEIKFITTDIYGSYKENTVNFNCNDTKPLSCVGIENCVSRAKAQQFFWLELNGPNSGDDFKIIIDPSCTTLYSYDNDTQKWNELYPSPEEYSLSSGQYEIKFITGVTTNIKFTVIYPDGSEKKYDYSLSSFNKEMFVSPAPNRRSR